MEAQELEDLVYSVLVQSGKTEDSSRGLAFYLTLHFPQHAEVLLRHTVETTEPTPEPEVP